MLLGVISDTHNNLKNINKIIYLFNKHSVDLVAHTGDISNVKALNKFADLNCDLVGVFGNNDRTEKGLKKAALLNEFDFKDPPLLVSKNSRNIAIFHEPDNIEKFLNENQDIDIVLHGHTHRYREEIRNGTLIFNPGESAGMFEGKNALGLVDLTNLTTQRIFF